MNNNPMIKHNNTVAFRSGLLLIGVLVVALLAFLTLRRNADVTAQSGANEQNSSLVAQSIPNKMVTSDQASEEMITNITSRDFGVWTYDTTSSNFSGIHSTVNYKHNSVSDIQDYVAANKALLLEVAGIGGPVEVTVTFMPPLSPDAFRRWVREHGATVIQAQIAVGAPGGTSGTIIVNSSADDPLPQVQVEKYPYVGMGDVFGMNGTIDSSNLAAAASDPNVFLLDVTPAWVKHDLLVSGYKEAAQAEVYIALPYGWMEILGIVPTPQPVPSAEGTIQPLVLPIAEDDQK